MACANFDKSKYIFQESMPFAAILEIKKLRVGAIRL